MKSLGLMEKHKNDTDFRLRMKKLAALDFVPVADVVATFGSHAIQFLQDELPLLSYFERTWIEAPVTGNRRLDPEFSLQKWKALDRASTGSALISCQHPTV